MSAQLQWEWEMTIEFNAKEIDEPYELYFFLGPVPASVADCEFRDLNGYLENHYGDKLKDDDVIPKLRKDLSWGVKQLYFNKKIENSMLKSLRVSVSGPDGEIMLID